MGLPQSGNEYEMYTRETNITTEKTAAVDAVELNPTVAGTIAKKLKDANTYSTDEVVIGTWIDGKPVYEKTFSLSTQNIEVAHGISNLKSVVSIDGAIANGTGSFLALSFSNPDAPSQAFGVIVTTSNIRIRTNNAYNSGISYIIVRYTKTTD